MTTEINNYNFGNTKITLHRKWVPVEELEKIANEFGFSSSDTLQDVLIDSGIDIKETSQGKKLADFNGVNFYLIGKGVVSQEFLCSILDYNFEDEYVPVIDIFNVLGEIMKSIKEEPSTEEVNTVLSALKEVVS